MTIKSSLFWLIAAFITITFRIIWLYDMEWKADEWNMYALASQASNSGHWPSLGLVSGVGIKNAGFSIWPFILFYKISHSPVNMALMVALGNLLALISMYILATRSGRDSEALKWGVALVGVNVITVLFSRKIWAQDLIPIWVAALWATQFMKNKNLRFLINGILIALAGQLHISGYFIGAGIFITSWISGENSLKRSGILILGFAIGMGPAMHWLSSAIAGNHTSDVHLSYILKFEYFLHAATDPLGLNVLYSLGNADALQFAQLKFKSIPTFIPVICALGIVYFSLKGLTKLSWNEIWGSRVNWLQSNLNRNLMAFVILPGILLTLSGAPIRSHYLIGAAPFLHALFAKLWLKNGRTGMVIVWVLQGVITACFLWYIHTHTTIDGDYGVPYRHQ